MMKKLAPLLFACLCYAPQISFAQCGTPNEPQFISSQADLDALSGCELFQGDLYIEGSDITNIDGLASLTVVLGNLNIYDTHITSIDSASLGSLTTVNEINIYNNQYLSACCGALIWQDALDLGTIFSVNFSSNASGCNSYFDAQATCLGEVPGCVDASAVNYNWQATLDDGSCLNGIDLQVSVSTILNSLQVNTFTSSDDCLVAEGCITGTGTRKTLRFTTTISNYGNEDFIIGYEVDDNSQFYYDDCHNHYHYEGYANYQVFNYPNLSPSATIGHKNGWCVMDLGGAVSSENPGWNTPGCTFTYGCSYMGISAGCSDTYSSGISCQWVDITDLADGEYVLAVSTNMETENYSPTPELDFSNNVVYVLFEIESDDQGVTSVISATEFDGSAINDICVLDSDAADLGFNFSDAVLVSEQQTLFPTAYLNEYYTEPIQFVLTENISLNSLDVSVDSLVINEVSDLPLGLNWACAPQSCSFPIGNSCLGLTGIPEETGSFNVNIAATLYFTDTMGISQQITLPYNGGNQWVDGLLGDNYQAFDSFTPSINITVVVPVYGCTDTLAINYSDTATFDDGSCELPNMGCTDPFSLNFNSEANFEDGSCEYCAEGIEWVVQMDLYDTNDDGWTGNNYYIINEWGDTSATGTLENGSQGVDLFCLAPGCYSVNVPNEGTYPDDLTWQITSAGFSAVNLTGSCPDSRPFSFLTECSEFFEGCMDSLACNYNPIAEQDNQICTYANDGYDCEGNCLSGFDASFSMASPNWEDGFYGAEYTVTSFDGDLIYQGPDDSGYWSTSVDNFCVSDGCYIVSVESNGYDGLSNYSWTFGDITGTTGETVTGINIGTGCVFGCTDSIALNYNPLAQINDANSCTYDFVLGCMDSLACNYNYLADTSDVSCTYANQGFDCNGICLVGTETSISVKLRAGIGTTYDFTYNGGTWSFLNQSTGVPVDSNYFNNQTTDDFTGCLADGCYEIIGTPGYSGYYFSYTLNGGDVVYVGDPITEPQFDYISVGEGGCDYLNGCFDTLANNFNESALISVDSLCTYDFIIGCTDSLACNFIDSAEVDDSSCTYPSLGFDCYGNCLSGSLQSFVMNSPRWEDGFYGAEYTVSTNAGIVVYQGPDDTGNWSTSTDQFCADDGCYTLVVTTNNYDGINNYNWSFGDQTGTTGQTVTGINIGTGCVYGCMDPLAENYNFSADISNLDSCIYNFVLGCMDSLACNYNYLADTSDVSCTYANQGFDCNGICLVGSETSISVKLRAGIGTTYDFTYYGGTWSFLNQSTGVPVDSNYFNNQTTDDFTGCLADGCYEIIGTPGYSGYYFSYTLNGGDVVYVGDPITEPQFDYISVGEGGCDYINGCTDTLADNYDSLAILEDGSCILSVTPGCNDSLACNFDIFADVDDGSCDLVSCLDACGIPNGDNTSCADACGVPNGDNSSCTDCAGVVNGDSSQDACGVCDSDSINNDITCLDCAGVPNGTSVDFGCGCGEPALELGYDCDGNLIPLVCDDSSNVGYYAYEDNDDTTFEYVFDSSEIVMLTIVGETEINNSGGCYDYIYVYDGSGTLIETLCGSFNQTILSNDNGMSIIFETDGSVSVQSGQVNPSSWLIECAIQGCMDPIAENYNSFAIRDDSTCTYVYGCMDLTACNYDSLATVNNDYCTYPSEGFDCDSNCTGDNCLEHQDIYLSAGWSIMSSYIENEGGDSIDVVIQPIVESVVILKNNEGSAYLPDWNFNAIGSWDNTQGYQLKLTDPEVLTINGIQVKPEETPVSISAGWNMIAYLRVEDADLVAVFNDIIDDIVIVKDFMGSAYLPEWDFNAIGDMTAGQGYQIKMNQANELIYNENGEAYRTTSHHVIDNGVSHINFDKNTGSNMHLIIPQDTWSNRVADGDEVYVYNTQGAKVGAAKVTLPNTVVTLWGNDLLTNQKDGLDDGEQWHIVLFSVESESLIPLSFELKEDYCGFQQNAIVVASQITESFTESKTVLFNSVPNPTSNHTEITFYLNKDLYITLRLFNAIGEEIKVISKGLRTLGYHSVQLDVSYLEPGIYFYQLESKAEQITKSLEVIK